MAILELKFIYLLLLTVITSCDVQGIAIGDARLSAFVIEPDGITLPGDQGVGTVEVFIDQYSTWLPVCYTTSWDNSVESKVICRQLGFNTTHDPATDRALQPSNCLSLDFNFECSGSESELNDCSYQFLYEHTSCYPILVSCTSCREGSIRLYNATSQGEGIVESCRGGFWWAVCDMNWNYLNSFVVCRQLGLPATAADTVPPRSFSVYHPFPLGVYFNCFGNESSLIDCRATGTLQCTFNNTARIQCAGEMVTGISCADGDIRLIGGRQSEIFNEGRVEICSNGVWGTIYDQGSWNDRDAIVVCRQLGYNMAIPYRGGLLGSGSGPILYAYLSCIGNETLLSQCRTSRSLTLGTAHFSDAGVRCLNESRSNCSDGDTRLVNGTTMFEGRVELCYRGMWGLVCDNSWGSKDAATVCRLLGFQQDGAVAVTGSYFGSGKGPYVLSSTHCSKSVRDLAYCGHTGIHDYTAECSPGHDAGVICEACSHGEVRSIAYKPVEVCINGTWAGICSNVINASAVAKMLCKQLTGAEKSFHTESCSTPLRYIDMKAVAFLHNISCDNQSRSVVNDCSFNILSRSASEQCSILDVVCFPHSNCTEGAIRLADGENSLDGRVEVCVNGFWGTLPPPEISSVSGYRSTELEKAERICRQFGFPWEWAIPLTISGNYPHIMLYHGENHHYRPSCSRGNAFGVLCQGDTSKPKECQHLDVRLVNGSRKTEGRLEFCAYGYWSNLCNDKSLPSYSFKIGNAWPSKAPELICHKLGFPTEVMLYISNGAPFGSSPLLLPSVGIHCHDFAYGSIYDFNRIQDISDCQIINQSNFCPVRDKLGISCGEREQYKISIEVYPAQESYDIGTQVTLRCILPPSLQSSPFITIDWKTTVPNVLPYVGLDRSNISFVVPAHHPMSANYYCSIQGMDYPPTEVARQRITIKIKALLQRSNIDEHIKVEEEGSVRLQVETPDTTKVTRLLSELTWYHNGTVMLPVPDENERITFSDDKKTLTISNFSSTDAGVYKVQFNKIVVQPYNQTCNDEVISLLRGYPILAPAVYCVNVNPCTSEDPTTLQVQRVCVRRLNFNLRDGLTLVADGLANSAEELQHLSLEWYRNGKIIYFSNYYYRLTLLQQQYPTISQELQAYSSEVVYEYTGRYEVALTIKSYVYDPDSNCQAYYGQLLAPYASYRYKPEVPLSWGYIDVSYHKDVDLYFNTDENTTTTTRDEGATLACQASVGFPPFSNLSLFKNQRTVAASSNGMLQINTKSVNANPFGLYICQLNASGEIFEESTFVKEQVSFMMTIEFYSQFETICDNSTEFIEQALFSKISKECRCNFSRDDFIDSSTDCEDSGKLTYTSTIEYSNNEGSETASVITDRLIHQAPFSLVVDGMLVGVVAVDCTSCRSSLQSDATKLNNSFSPAAATNNSFSPAAVSGLFIGGFATGAFIVLITVFIVIIIVICTNKCRHPNAKESMPGESDKTPNEYALVAQCSKVD